MDFIDIPVPSEPLRFDFPPPEFFKVPTYFVPLIFSSSVGGYFHVYHVNRSAENTRCPLINFFLEPDRMHVRYCLAQQYPTPTFNGRTELDFFIQTFINDSGFELVSISSQRGNLYAGRGNAILTDTASYDFFTFDVSDFMYMRQLYLFSCFSSIRCVLGANCLFALGDF